MNKIWYFGDSNTAGIGNTGAPDGCDYHHIPYSKYLTDIIQYESINLAWGGKPFMLNVTDLCENLNNYISGDIIIFQIQYLTNSVLRFGNQNVAISSGRFHDSKGDPMIGLLNDESIGITEDDTLTLLEWTLKFEERRSIYDLDTVISILRYLRSMGIQTHLLYWIDTYDIPLPINELVINIDGENIVTKLRLVDNEQYVIDATNGIWKDYHTSNEWNKSLAKKIAKKFMEPKQNLI